MWNRLPNASESEIATLRGSKKAKLYADEDIEEEVVEFFRENGVNISSARELGHRGKPDSFHADLSFKERRFLLTKNAKHYLDDREVPFHRLHGIIALEGDMGKTNAYAKTLLQVFDLMPYGEIYQGMKIRLSPNEAMFRFIDGDGRLVVRRVKNERGQLLISAPMTRKRISTLPVELLHKKQRILASTLNQNSQSRQFAFRGWQRQENH